MRLLLARELPGAEVIAVSNREPYIHNRTSEGNVELQIPASGLVAALEPVMRACGGTWIAHGSGSADRETADAAGRIAVPPAAPAYATHLALGPLIVNPYDAHAMGEVLHRALVMPKAEQRARMRLMRDLVRGRNVYRWAGEILLDAAKLRQRAQILRMVSAETLARPKQRNRSLRMSFRIG